MGKLMVFSSAVRHGYTWLVVIGVLNSAVSAYYYLRLIMVMFFRERTAPWVAPLVPASIVVALVITVAGVFYLGLFPGRVTNALGAQPRSPISIR
jgi:NADH-quinone oxidoreductase subunit N